jgi:hypothetical protein
VRGASTKLVAVMTALLLATAMAACGSGDSSTSTTTEAGGSGSEGKPSTTASKPAGKSGSGGKSGSSTGEGQSKSSGSSGNSGTFVPKHHEDSGGGSKPYRVKGGDNSIQEYGSEADASELDAVAAVMHDFLDARAAGDWSAACKYISKKTIDSFNQQISSQSNPGEKLGCAKVLELLINPAAKKLMTTEAAKADVRSVRIEGKQAFAIYTATGNTALAMPMEREGSGAWKVVSIAGTPLS